MENWDDKLVKFIFRVILCIPLICTFIIFAVIMLYIIGFMVMKGIEWRFSWSLIIGLWKLGMAIGIFIGGCMVLRLALGMYKYGKKANIAFAGVVIIICIIIMAKGYNQGFEFSDMHEEEQEIYIDVAHPGD